MQPYCLPGPLGSHVLKSWPVQHQLALMSCAVWLACSLYTSWLSPDALLRPIQLFSGHEDLLGSTTGQCRCPLHAPVTVHL